MEQELAKALGEELREFVDFDILADMLTGITGPGWTKVILGPMLQERSTEIDSWIDAECTDEHKNMGLVWLFKDAKDAIMFKLKWS